MAKRIVRVHPEILRSEGVADGEIDNKAVWQSRFRSIVHLERHLHLNGTRIVKFYLHLSKKEQRERFLQRIDEPQKNWKFSLADVEEGSGGTTCRRARSVSVRQALAKRRGMSSLPMTKRTRG